MSTITLSSAPKACEPYPLDAQMVELPLLLPAWQARELEKEADERGLTAGKMVRQVLRDFIARLQTARNQSFVGDPWE